MLHLTWWVPVLTVVLWTSSAEGARILALFPAPSHSHYFVGHKLLRELATRGHDVTMVSPFRNKEPMQNYRDIVLERSAHILARLKKSKKMKLTDLDQKVPWMQTIFISNMISIVSEIALQDRNFQNLLQSNETFDLVILEIFYSEVLYGLAHRFDCPLLVFSSVGPSSWTNHLVANPAPNSYVPELFTSFAAPMSFVERLVNGIQNMIVSVHREFFYIPRLNALLHKYFPNAPSLEELMYTRTDLILLNSHHSFSDARPHVPNMIQIGGFHIDEPKALPKDLKDLMDNAKHGVILFSMGSNLKSTDFTNETCSAIVSAFAKLKQAVIWKWDNENVPDKPANVKIMKWCPQNDIIAHPNLKVFITHGGQSSTIEAVHYGVPVIGIPIFSDQKVNVAMASRKGFCVGINYRDLSEDTLTTALNEILNNPKYRRNAKLRSQLLRDQPIRPIDTAIYWTEYVIKHKGAAHLRTAAMDLAWYQLYSVDLIAFVICTVIILYYTINKMLNTKKQRTKKIGKKKNN